MINTHQPVLLPLKQITLPIEQGWKRKIVESGEGGAQGPSIHYVRPDGEQVYTSKTQIKEYLAGLPTPSTLSPDWFIFSAAVILEKEIEYECNGENKLLNRVPSTETDIFCSRSCPGRGGTRPSLHCKQCLTYFHPKCVNSTEEEFVCQSCTQVSELEQRSKRKCNSAPAYTHLPDKAVKLILLCLDSAADLVNASKVCKQWHSVSKETVIWRRVSFANITLSDKWSSFKSQFSNLTKLDTRGMRFTTHVNKVWEVLAPVLGSVPTLKFITLGAVTSPVVSVLLNSIKGVKQFHAQFIVHESTRRYNDNKQTSEVELSACSFQPHLRHFSICSPTQLRLAPDCDLTPLRKLQRLQSLSVTSFTPGSLTRAGLGFISHLRNLSSLELGSCSDWSEEQYSILSNLTNLQHLRLESGPVEGSVGLSTALVKLHQLVQLELIAFPIHRTLRQVVAQLPKLNLLNLAPAATDNTELSGMNQIVLAIMKEGKIWCGEWGALISPHKTCHVTSNVIPVIRAYVADSVLYKAASRRGQGDILMINMSEAKLLLQDCLPEHGVASVYTLSNNTAHWIKMCQ